MNDISYRRPPAKIDKEGRFPVYLIFQDSGTSFEYYTKERCKPEQWDADKMRFRRLLPGYQQANEYLESLTEKIRGAVRSARAGGLSLTNELLRLALAGVVRRSGPGCSCRSLRFVCRVSGSLTV